MQKASKTENRGDLRKLQLVELDILKQIVKICDKHNLTYYISGGTFLGAIRHKGFIPWDDDIDIAMPRTSYEKFATLAQKELPKKYKYISFKTDESVKVCFARVENSEVKVKDTSALEASVRNAWVDIFPLDGMPKSKIKFFIRKYKLLYLRMMLQYSQFSKIVNQNLPNRPMFEKVLIAMGKIIPFEKILKTRKYMFKIDRELKKYDEHSEYIMNFLGIYKFRSVMNYKKIYGNGAKYLFEDAYFNAPKQYDAYLTQIYGDYMTPPKTQHKNKHHTEVIS